MNILINCSFLGEHFYGTQKQSEKITVQGVIEEKLSTLFSTNIKTTTCSRLDRGVNALDFYLSFKIDKEVNLSHLRYFLNRSLGPDIFFKDIKEVPDSFSPRYSAHSKTYLYLIQNSDIKNPLLANITYIPPQKLDKKLLKECGKLFVGVHDFKYLSKPLDKEENTVMTIDSFSIDEDDLLKIRFKGSAFLRYQIRFMVGTMLRYSKKKISKEEVEKLLRGEKIQMSPLKAEPQGLLLEKVEY